MHSSIKHNSQESSLSFQSIKNSYQCCQHTTKKAKYTNKINSDKYCYGCAIQLASKGIPIQLIPNNNNSISPQQLYIKTQNQIRSSIQQYNQMFKALLEMLTDMQIKDLMNYNRLLQQNDKKFQASKQDFTLPSKQIQLKITRIQQHILNTISNSLKSYESIKHPQTSSTKQQNSSIKQISSNSININPNKSLQDTPESIKSKISLNRGKVKQPPVGMFERIDVCQSLEGCQQFTKNNKCVENTTKNQYRYGRCSIE